MYCDPFAAEGLFLLAEDENKTERDLPFEFDPKVDYFAKFDSMLPAWRPSPYKAVDGSGAAWTADGGGPVVVPMAKRQTRTLSHRRYVRAIAPDGSLRQLIVSTIRATPEFKDGLDVSATLQTVIARKNARGWIVVENVDWVWNSHSGRRGQQYAAWALAVMEYRKARHTADEAGHDKAFRNQAVVAVEKQTETIAKALSVALSSRDDNRRGKQA
jgi:hypothetical protein